jgi:hypothetical protein
LNNWLQNNWIITQSPYVICILRWTSSPADSIRWFLPRKVFKLKKREAYLWLSKTMIQKERKINWHYSANSNKKLALIYSTSASELFHSSKGKSSWPCETSSFIEITSRLLFYFWHANITNSSEEWASHLCSGARLPLMKQSHCKLFPGTWERVGLSLDSACFPSEFNWPLTRMWL